MKKAIKDIILNIFSTALPLVALQFIALPYAAKVLDGDRYGLAVTIISFISIVPISVGSALNNIKLLTNNSYEEMETGDDYKILLFSGAVLNAISTILFLYYFFNVHSIIDIILTLVMSCLTLCKEFLIVYFLVNVDYKKVFINNIFLTLGYFIGLLFFKFCLYWQVIYVFGLAFSLIHIFSQIKIEHIKHHVTPLFFRAAKETAILMICFILSKTTIYADKLLLYPLLGGESVSIYYISSLMGKTISLGIGPVQGVFLTNLAKKKQETRNMFKNTFLLSVLFGAAAYFITLFLCKPVLRLLYPGSYLQAMELAPITTSTAIISSIATLLNSFLLKYCNLKWQLGVSSLGVALYIAFAFWFFKLGGIHFYCYGILLATILKLVMIILVYLCRSHNRLALKKREEHNETMEKSIQAANN